MDNNNIVNNSEQAHVELEKIKGKIPVRPPKKFKQFGTFLRYRVSESKAERLGELQERYWRQFHDECNVPKPKKPVDPRITLANALKKLKPEEDLPFVQEKIQEFLQRGQGAAPAQQRNE